MPFKLMKFSSNIAAGLGSVKSLGEYFEDLKLSRKALIISGEKSYQVAGEMVSKSLQGSNIQTEEFIGKFEPTRETAEKFISKLLKYKGTETAIVAIGGGSVADICKYVAKELNLDLVVIPTLLASDAIATGYSVLWEKGKNQAIQTKTPSLIVGDYEILRNQPKRFVSAGAGDMLSKISALYDWRLAFWLGNESYNDFAMNVAKSTTELLEKRILDVSKMNYIGIETLFLAEVTDGYLMELSGSTRVAAGSEHLFAFAMETLDLNGIHGEYCALGTILMSYLQSRDKMDTREYLQAVGAPTTASELDIKPYSIVKALTMAHKMRPWYTILGQNGLSEGSAERLARYTHVIS